MTACSEHMPLQEEVDWERAMQQAFKCMDACARQHIPHSSHAFSGAEEDMSDDCDGAVDFLWGRMEESEDEPMCFDGDNDLAWLGCSQPDQAAQTHHNAWQTRFSNDAIDKMLSAYSAYLRPDRMHDDHTGASSASGASTNTASPSSSTLSSPSLGHLNLEVDELPPCSSSTESEADLVWGLHQLKKRSHPVAHSDSSKERRRSRA
jgi:hypothetical protein